MEKEELKNKIYAFVLAAKGKKKVKARDIEKAVSVETGASVDEIKQAIREMVDIGRVMYSYTGGASSVEIPTEEYLREKGMIK